jgi:glycosyltransferase involved in cell wall biosynthesis
MKKTLPRCLDSVKDTFRRHGIEGQDRGVAESYDYEIYQFEWINDFAAAKNYAISKARGKWIIFLDADEYFTSDSIPLIPDIDIINKVHIILPNFICRKRLRKWFEIRL